jgi:hypothetical protein
LLNRYFVQFLIFTLAPCVVRVSNACSIADTHNTQVGMTDVARFPVQALATTIATSNYSTLVSTLASTPDAFAVTLRSAVLLVQ